MLQQYFDNFFAGGHRKGKSCQHRQAQRTRCCGAFRGQRSSPCKCVRRAVSLRRQSRLSAWGWLCAICKTHNSDLRICRLSRFSTGVSTLLLFRACCCFELFALPDAGSVSCPSVLGLVYTLRHAIVMYLAFLAGVTQPVFFLVARSVQPSPPRKHSSFTCSGCCLVCDMRLDLINPEPDLRKVLKLSS